jgi:hypothetical protein
MNMITRGLGALALATTLLAATPSFAMSDWCYSEFWVECSTMEIPANPSHFVFIKIAPWTSYRVNDSQNNVVVSAGSIGGEFHTEVIWGLYAWYKLTIKSWAGAGTINNT